MLNGKHIDIKTKEHVEVVTDRCNNCYNVAELTSYNAELGMFVLNIMARNLGHLRVVRHCTVCNYQLEFSQTEVNNTIKAAETELNKKISSSTVMPVDYQHLIAAYKQYGYDQLVQNYLPKFAESFPISPTLNTYQAQELLSNGQVKEAVAILKRAYQQNATDPMVISTFIDALGRLGKVELMNNVLLGYNRAHPDNPDVLLQLAISLGDCEHLTAAQAVLQKIQSSDPEYYQAHHLSNLQQLLEKEQQSNATKAPTPVADRTEAPSTGGHKLMPILATLALAVCGFLAGGFLYAPDQAVWFDNATELKINVSIDGAEPFELIPGKRSHIKLPTGEHTIVIFDQERPQEPLAESSLIIEDRSCYDLLQSKPFYLYNVLGARVYRHMTFQQDQVEPSSHKIIGAFPILALDNIDEAFTPNPDEKPAQHAAYSSLDYSDLDPFQAGIYLRKRGDLAAASQFLNHCIQIGYQPQQALEALVDLFISSGQTDLAVQTARAVLEGDPQNLYLHIFYQDTLLRLGMSNRAMAEYKVFRQQDPKSSYFGYLLARLLPNDRARAIIKELGEDGAKFYPLLAEGAYRTMLAGDYQKAAQSYLELMLAIEDPISPEIFSMVTEQYLTALVLARELDTADKQLSDLGDQLLKNHKFADLFYTLSILTGNLEEAEELVYTGFEKYRGTPFFIDRLILNQIFQGTHASELKQYIAEMAQVVRQPMDNYHQWGLFLLNMHQGEFTAATEIYNQSPAYFATDQLKLLYLFAQLQLSAPLPEIQFEDPEYERIAAYLNDGIDAEQLLAGIERVQLKIRPAILLSVAEKSFLTDQKDQAFTALDNALGYVCVIDPIFVYLHGRYQTYLQ